MFQWIQWCYILTRRLESVVFYVPLNTPLHLIKPLQVCTCVGHPGHCLLLQVWPYLYLAEHQNAVLVQEACHSTQGRVMWQDLGRDMFDGGQSEDHGLYLIREFGLNH